MQQVSKFCLYCLHKLWVVLALCLVLLAVAISLLRLTLPYAEGYKHHLEQLLTQQLGTVVTIGQLDASWQRTGPALLLENVRLQSAYPFELTISETAIQLNFWQSLLTRSVTAEHFVLTGLHLQLSGAALNQQNSEEANHIQLIQALEQLFFRQLRTFSVRDSAINLVNDDYPDQRLQISRLHWQNAGDRHQGYGEISLQDITANSLSFILDFNGASWREAAGQLYLQSAELNVLPWLRNVIPQSSRLQSASVNFQAWASFTAGQFQQLQVELAENSLHWLQKAQSHHLSLGPGQLLWQTTANGWQLNSGQLVLSDQQQHWPGFHIAMRSDAEQYLANLEDFPLLALLPLATLLAEQEPALNAVLTYQPAGYLRLLQAQSSAQGWQWYGAIEQLSTQAVADVPGLEQIDLHFTTHAGQTIVSLSGQSGELQWDGLFTEAWPYQQLDALLRLQPAAAGFTVEMPHFILQQADFTLAANAVVTLAERPELSLVAQLQGLDAARAYRYYPQRYMPIATRDYLTTAIEAGRIQQATVVWQGAFADFPFSGGEGHFQVYAGLSEGQFRFAPDWPALTDLAAELWFENAAMQIVGREGLLGLLPLTTPVYADIVDLRTASQLTIALDTALDASTLTDLMLDSALHGSLGKTLQHLGLAGPVNGALLLEIGLSQPGVVASGYAQLDNVQAQLVAPSMQLDQLSGVVHFRNDVLQAEQLQFSYLGLPMTGQFNGKMHADGYQLQLALQGETEEQQLAALLWPAAGSLLQGKAEWQLQLELALPEQGFTYQARLEADLSDLALQLPAPFAKSAGQAAEWVVMATGDTAQSALAITSPQLFDFKALLNHQTGRIQQAKLALGAEPAVLSQPDFNIEVALEQADVVEWFSFLQPLLAPDAAASDFMPPLQRVRGRIGELALAGPLTIQHTVFDLQSDSDAWQLQLNGAELASRWQFYHQWQTRGMAVQFDYLHLVLPETPTVSATEAAGKPVPELLPQNWLAQMAPLHLSCNDCAIGNYRLGQVNLRAAGNGEFWQLTEFSSNYKGHRLALSGFWQPDQNLGLSQFEGRFVSPNLGNMLNEFGLTSAISGSRSELSLALNWQGAPQQFSLAALNGQVNFNLGEGALTEVSDQGARLFSLFSLNSMLRKLRLDFRDVFAKGFFYNRMSGNLSLEQGVAQTSDFVIDGVPGNMHLQGYADLLKRELDYQVAFSPKVTSSLPVIIAWMVNPATGLAALALDEVFQSAEVISRINFTVTGSFDKPQVTEVNRHSTEVPVPVRIAQPERRDDETQPSRLN